MPGVPLLSRCRWSGFPVDVAILFGPGLIAWIVCMIFLFVIDFSLIANRWESRCSGAALEVDVTKVYNVCKHPYLLLDNLILKMI